MAPAPCIECKRRAKALPRQRCATCLLRHLPIGDQVRAARARLEMVPPELRKKRTKAMAELAPVGTEWCAGCQSYRDTADFRNAGKTSHTQCYACRSGKSHAAMVKRTYGIEGEQYEALLELQSGGCAVCGSKPKTKRLAVDHDHKTGAVRGLLCKRHNKDALGALHDSLAMVTALWHYLNTPPATGDWLPIGEQGQLLPAERGTGGAVSEPESRTGIVGPSGGAVAPQGRPSAVGAGDMLVLPIGSQSVPGKRGVWRYYVEPDGDPPF